MSISKLAVNRPVTIWMFIIGLIVLGGVSITRLPLTLLPDLNFPAAAVMVEYPNVGPWEVESQVTRPIEEVMATVSNVTRVTSLTEMGVATVVVQFNWGTDMDFATLEMRERLDLIAGYLPDDVERPQVFKFDPSMSPIFQFNIGGDMELSEIRRLAEDTIQPRLERLEGVASVTIDGGSEREIRVELDQLKMEQYNISVDQVRQVLAAGNLNFPAGKVTDRGRELLIRTIGEYTSIDEIAQTVVHIGPAGMIRLEDIADILDTYKPETRITRLNGTPSVSVSLQKESEANTVQVSNRIQAEVENIMADLGDTLDIQVVWDDARMIRSSIRSVIENGLVGAIAATIVLLVFLGSLGPTLVVASSIPVAAIATFFFLHMFDISLNMLSLGGLALGLGMLVDNAIVSLENIARHRQLGLEPNEASIIGAQEIGGALFASTLTTVAVFLPVVFVGGLAAEIFNDLSFAVAVSLIISLVVALTFVPMITTRVRVAGITESGRAGWIVRLREAYGRALQWFLDRRAMALTLVLVALAITAVAFPFVGREFLPAMDSGEFDVQIALPYGTPRERTNQFTSEVEGMLARIPEVDTISASIVDERADLYVRVRSGRGYRDLDRVIADVRAFAANLPGADIQVRASDPFGVEGALSSDISLLVKGPDSEAIARVAEDIAALIRTVPGTAEVDTSVSRGRPELQIRLDRDNAARYGLTVAQVASSARVALDGALTTRYRAADEDGRELDVTVQLAEAWRQDPSQLERLLISTPLGVNVRLGDIAEITEGLGPVLINREGGSRVVRVYGEVVGRDLNSVTRDIEEELAQYPLPPEVTLEFGGDVVEMEDAFNQLGFALVLAVILMFMILAAQFESLAQPFIIIFTVPLALIGVIAGLLITGRTLSVPTMVGVIMLVGIAVNNAIVLIDYINQLRERGYETRKAIIEGCKARMRPVLMTTLTTILGMVPMAFGIGDGAELQAPMATVVIGGLTVTTFLTLGYIPMLYEVFAEWGAKLGKRREKSAGEKTDGMSVSTP